MARSRRVPALAAIALAACKSSDGAAVVSACPAAGDAGPLAHLTATPVKVAQLVGDWDRETSPPTPTPNRTETRFGLVGNDLGYSFLHKGRLYLLFGDTAPRDRTASRPMDADSIAVATDPLPAPGAEPPDLPEGLHIDFLTDTDGQYLPVRLDGKTLGTLRLPMTGVSTGSDMVVFFAADAGTVLGVSHDDGRSFSTGAIFPTDPLPACPQTRIANIVPRLVATADVGLSSRWASPQTLLMYARKGFDATVLVAAPFDALLDVSQWAFFGGFGAGGAPVWTTGDALAPVVPAMDGCGGNFSVTPLPGLGRWLMLNHCGSRFIEYRVATSPLGPWSTPRIFFDKERDGGVCHFMHRACNPDGGPACCDDDVQPTIDDPRGRPQWGPGWDSYPYAPMVLEPWMRWDAASGTLQMYFLMSVFNPYSPMVMKTTIVDADLN